MHAASRARRVDADLCVVGAGIVGLAHAHEGRRRGLRVVVLERDDRAVGASVRNFGHRLLRAWRRRGPRAARCDRARALARARRARQACRCAAAARSSSPATRDELAVLEGAAANPRRGARMLTRRAGRRAGADSRPASWSARCTRRSTCASTRAAAVAGLANLLDRDDGARVEWGAARSRGRAGRGPCRSACRCARRAIVVCPGPDYAVAARRCCARRPRAADALHSCRCCGVAAPAGPSLRAGARDRPEHDPLSRVRRATGAPRSCARAWLREAAGAARGGIHLLVTQLPDGDLIVGDTHTYGDTPAPFAEERLYGLLLDEARALLGVEPEVRERWQGTYPALRSPDAGNFHLTAPLPGVRVVQNVAGIGMALSFGQAPAVLDDLLRGQDMSASPTPARGSAARL